MTFKEQLEIFSSARNIIGIHGAGLANVLFMPSGGTMVKIRRHESGPGNVGYWHLADALGQRYYYVNGVSNSE